MVIVEMMVLPRDTCESAGVCLCGRLPCSGRLATSEPTSPVGGLGVDPTLEGAGALAVAHGVKHKSQATEEIARLLGHAHSSHIKRRYSRDFVLDGRSQCSYAQRTLREGAQPPFAGKSGRLSRGRCDIATCTLIDIPTSSCLFSP